MNNKKLRNKDLPSVGTHVCAICGAEFPITRRQAQKIYCDSCKPMHVDKWRKNYRFKYRHGPDREKILARDNELAKKRRVYKTYTCALCGQEFEHKNGGRPKYCLPCLLEHRYEYPFAAYLRQRVDYEGGDI